MLFVPKPWPCSVNSYQYTAEPTDNASQTYGTASHEKSRNRPHCAWQMHGFDYDARGEGKPFSLIPREMVYSGQGARWEGKPFPLFSLKMVYFDHDAMWEGKPFPLFSLKMVYFDHDARCEGKPFPLIPLEMVNFGHDARGEGKPFPLIPLEMVKFGHGARRESETEYYERTVPLCRCCNG